MAAIRKPNNGLRKKIEIKKLEVADKCQVTFSKRKAGIFSKAGQLCTLTGAEAAIVIFSPHGSKVYCYGHPKADTVIDQYLSGYTFHNHQPSVFEAADDYNKHYEEASKELEMEKKRGVMIQNRKKAGDYNFFWWEDQVIEGLELEELEQYTASLEEFRKNVALRIEELSAMNVNMNNNNNYYAPASTSSFAMDSALVNGIGPVNALHYNQPACYGTNARFHNLGFNYGQGKI